MITQAFLDCQNFHILLSAFFITILLFLVLFFDYSIEVQLVITVLTLITYGILAKSVYDAIKSKTKNKLAVHKFQYQSNQKTQQQWIPGFQNVCRKIIMEKRLKQMEEDPYSYQRYRSSQTFSIEKFKEDYRYNREDPRPMTSILVSTEIIIGNSKKLVLQNYELRSTDAQKIIEDKVLKKLGLQISKKDQATKLIKNFLSVQLEQALAQIQENIYKVNELLSSNLGKKLTHNFYPSENQITLSQLEQLLAIYKRSRTLPTEYLTNMRNTETLDALMEDLKKAMDYLQIIIGYESKNIPLNMTIFILKTVFRRETILIGNSRYRSQEMGRRSKEHVISVHMNQKLRLQSCPELKTDKCVIFSLLFGLNLLKNHYGTDYSILRSLKKFCD